MFSALVGTSTSGAFIESATGIREGARTGLAAVTTALLFAAALFFIPLIAPLQEMRYAYGPALMAVGVLMLGSVKRIDFDDLTEAVPAATTIALMLFTFNIANGLTAGLVLYPVFKVLAGRFGDLSAGNVVLGMLCLGVLRVWPAALTGYFAKRFCPTHNSAGSRKHFFLCVGPPPLCTLILSL